MAYRFLETRRLDEVEYVSLNRPEVRNAFNDVLIQELNDWAHAVAGDPKLRVVVLGGNGKVFCAGADLSWMAGMIRFTQEENRRDASTLAALLKTLNQLPQVLIGRVHGAALGGGAGLISICDIVVAAEDAVFGFTEVKLGILPAVIAPYALGKIGPAVARELFLTGRRFGAARAYDIGLVHQVVPASALDTAVEGYVREVLTSGPEAVKVAKSLIRRLSQPPTDAVISLTIETIAERRTSPEGQAGMKAFLQKAPAPWIREHLRQREQSADRRGLNEERKT